MATACGVGPAGCSDSPDGDEGDLQTRPLTRGRSETERRGDRVSSDDDGKTPGGPGLQIGMGKMINVAKNSWGKMLRLGVERRREDERDRQERRAGLCAARLELGSTGRAGDKYVLREVSTERNTWGLTWRQEVETRVSRWRSKLVKYMGKQWALRTIT